MTRKLYAVLIATVVLVSLVLIACSTAATPFTPTETPKPSATSEATTIPIATATGEPASSQRLASCWIEVSLDEQVVTLHDGDEVVGEYPVSTGVGISPETTTYPGEYRIQSMWPGPEETVPGVFVEDIIVFDWEHGNGFHSLPMDADGNILDATLGEPASAGCIRLAASKELYQFAEIGMKVVIH